MKKKLGSKDKRIIWVLSLTIFCLIVLGVSLYLIDKGVFLSPGDGSEGGEGSIIDGLILVISIVVILLGIIIFVVVKRHNEEENNPDKRPIEVE